MDRKKFLFVSLDGLIADIAWQVVKEGHEAKLFIEAKEEQEIGDGFVPKTDDWVREVPWADIVVFDDVLGQGAKAHQLRQTGKLVIGGSPYTDQLEDDRAEPGSATARRPRLHAYPGREAPRLRDQAALQPSLLRLGVGRGQARRTGLAVGRDRARGSRCAPEDAAP